MVNANLKSIQNIITIHAHIIDIIIIIIIHHLYGMGIYTNDMNANNMFSIKASLISFVSTPVKYFDQRDENKCRESSTFVIIKNGYRLFYLHYNKIS